MKPPKFDEVLVRAVIAGSPAAEAGVQTGDRILRIRVGPAEFRKATSLAQVSDALSKAG